jgi:hypothetical protein
MIKEMPKEPSKNFFRYFVAFLILNIIFSVVGYIISPEQVPSKITSQGFENYRSKIIVFFPVLFQLILLPMALIFYKILPPILRIYPGFLQRFYMRFSGLLLGINPEGLNVEILISKYISVVILTMSAILIPVNFVMIGFSLELSNLSYYLSVFLVIILVLIIPIFRLFSKKLQ